MPLLKVQTNVAIDPTDRKKLMEELSARVAGDLGKGESYMIVVVEPQAAVMLGSDSERPAAFVEVRSAGELTPGQAKKLSQALSESLCASLGIAADRVYCNFAAIPRTMWGFAGSTLEPSRS